MKNMICMIIIKKIISYFNSIIQTLSAWMGWPVRSPARAYGDNDGDEKPNKNKKTHLGLFYLFESLLVLA